MVVSEPAPEGSDPAAPPPAFDSEVKIVVVGDDGETEQVRRLPSACYKNVSAARTN